MPATIEAVFIVLVFVMPGFVTLQTRDFFVPVATRPEPLPFTLHSISVSLFYLPLWLISLPTLARLRGQLVILGQPNATGPTAPVTWDIVALALVHAVAIPALCGLLWGVAIWNDWHGRAARRLYGWLHLPAPHPGVGSNLWDRLWLNRRHVPWLTVYMTDGRIYVGRGVEFALSSETREILLGADTSMYDRDWNFVRTLPRGEGVWIAMAQVSSIDIHE